MLTIKYGVKFKKDYRLAIRRGCDESKFKKVVNLLQEEKPLPLKHRDHHLENSRNYQNLRECHIAPDWLLIYQVKKELKILRLVRTGSHSDLF